ncbi:MAG: hypothetical protein HKN47_14600 [Pirellulaceae bacterium]|nr:hypothetical protein [Pirellulaceae bacterium]
MTGQDHHSALMFLRPLAKTVAASLLAVSLCGSTGCSLTSGACRAVSCHNGLDKFMVGYRNKVLAAKAWHKNKHCFKHRKNRGDFQAGFMAGYINVAEGGSGCVPSIAPSSYWGWRYQSADGQAAINQWFAGYPLGAQLAEQDGVNNWSQIRPNNMNSPQSRQAVFVPPPVSEGENPFYQTEQYPYEPAPVESVGDTYDNGAAIDGPIRDTVEQELGGLPVDDMELNDDIQVAPPEPNEPSVGDAIRDALDAPVGEDDSASVQPNLVPQATTTVGDMEPNSADNNVRYVIEDNSDSEGFDGIFGQGPTTTVTDEGMSPEDLPFKFE